MFIAIALEKQRLTLWHRGRRLFEAPVSTALRGPGEAAGSLCTPRGRHAICAKIGEGCPPDTVFVARRPAGRYTEALARPGRDFILARILWLTGLEAHNRNTRERFIYIHGCPPELPLGIPLSSGCIRMHPRAIMDLFGKVAVGTEVVIR